MELVSRWLPAQPLWFSALIVLGAGSGVTALGSIIVNEIFTPQELAQNNTVAGFKFAFLGQVVSALLGFVLLEAATSYIRAQSHVRSELTALSYRGVVAQQMDPPVSRPLIDATRTYVLAVVTEEWPAMSHGQESEAAAALKDLYITYLNIPARDERTQALAQQNGQFLDRVIEQRTRRLADASEELSGLIWFAILVGVGVTIAFNWFFGSTLFAPQVAMGALLATAIMALVFLAIVLGHPFLGDLAIAPCVRLVVASIGQPRGR